MFGKSDVGLPIARSIRKVFPKTGLVSQLLNLARGPEKLDIFGKAWFFIFVGISKGFLRALCIGSATMGRWAKDGTLITTIRKRGTSSQVMCVSSPGALQCRTRHGTKVGQLRRKTNDKISSL